METVCESVCCEPVCCEVKPKVGTQIYDYGDTNIMSQQITTNVILLNGEDLSQLLQSLSDRIKALEVTPVPLLKVSELLDETAPV